MLVKQSDGVTVKLDGELIGSFVSADDDAGWVRVSADEVRRGKVEIISVHEGESLVKSGGAVTEQSRKPGWLDRR